MPRHRSGSSPPAWHLTRGERVFQNVEPPYRGTAPGSPFALVGFIGLCLLVAAADAAVTERSVHTWYLSLAAPPGTPPNWLFPPVWTALYLMIGVAGWLAWRESGGMAVRLWGWQLMANALWTPAFFGLHSPGAGMAVMAALLLLIVLTIRAFWGVSRRAALLMLPYAAWVGYAAYLNVGFLALNHP